MNCLVFLAAPAALLSLLLGPHTCQADSGSECDLSDCVTSCTELGALRWSCEEEGCLCTFLLDDAKALELGDEVEGEGGNEGVGTKEKESSVKDKVSSSGDKDGNSAKDADASNATKAPAQQTTKGRPTDTASSQKDAQKDQGQKKLTTRNSKKKSKKHGARTTEGQSDAEAKLTPSGSPQTSKKPDNKETSEGDAGQKDMGGISLLSRQALEPDNGGKSKGRSNVIGRTGAETSNMHIPFLVRSLERPLSKKQVMDQLKKQKGDIPMKDIEEFIMKG